MINNVGNGMTCYYAFVLRDKRIYIKECEYIVAPTFSFIFTRPISAKQED